MSTNDPPGLDPDGGDDTAEGRTSASFSSTNPTSPRSHVAEMDNLSERFSQQQVMISQLKELVIAEEAARNQKIASSRLKMEKCVSQLARIRDRAKGSRLKSDTPDSSVRSSQSMSVEPDNSSRSSITSSSAELSLHASSPIVTSTTATLTTTTSTPVTTVRSGAVKSGESTGKLKTPSREVTKMLHQQIQGHKAKIAKTAQHEKELEEALAKIQKQLEENQSQTAEMLQLGQPKSKVLLPSFVLEESNSESNKIITELKSRIMHLEGTILDLQETCKEKDSVIDSKTKAITLMSADLSKKGKNTLDLLDDTKEQMQQMQQNFASMESQMNEEKQKLADELETSKNRIFYLEEANSILETERFNLSVQNSFLEEQLAEKEKDINRMKEEMIENMKSIEELTLKVDKSIETDAAHEEKGSKEISEMNALSEKIEILEKLNSTLRQSNIELQEKISPSTTTIVKEVVKPTREESPKSKRGKATPKPKGSQKYKNLNPKPESPPKETPVEKESAKEMQETIDRLQVIIESLNKQVLEKEILLSQKEAESKEIKEVSLDTSVEESQSEPLVKSSESQIVKSEISDVSSASVDDKSDPIADTEPITESDFDDNKVKNIEAQLEDALKEIEKLTAQLVEANKSMIKVKAAHKKELKQMQKSIDDFSKVSNTNSEMIKLQSEVSVLTQKIAELEDEKGNLQLHLVDYDSGRVSDSQLHAKLMETENLAEERLKAIAELETQKFDLVQELHSVKQQIIALEDKVADLSFLENEHVSTELKSAQLEEQLDILENKNKEALSEIEHLKSEKDGVLATVEALNKEKVELNNKLEMYIQENMDLIEKLDKLSAEKVSSAESIEMVESLTSQEKMEIEQYQKGIDGSHMDKSKTRDEVEESLRRNSFSHSTHVENADLPSNIDIINQERHEFMEKLDSLKIENSGLSLKMEELLNEKKALEDHLESLKTDSSNFAVVLSEEKSKYDNLVSEVDALKQENNNLSELVKTLSSGKEARTEEVIVSETVEVEHVSEKEIIQPVSSSQTEAVEPPKESGNKAKNNKNQTKEILRLKNLVKQQEAEIENLNVQLTQVKENAPAAHDSSSEQQTAIAELEQAFLDNKVLNEEVLELKLEKDSYSQQLTSVENSYIMERDRTQRLSEVIAHLEEEIRDLQSKLKTSDGVTASLKATVDQHKSDMDVLNNIMQNKDDEIAQYKLDVEQLDAVSRKLKSTLSQIEDEKSASVNSIDRIKELENNLTKSNAAIQENETKIKELETKIEESMEYVEMLKAKINEYESTVNKTNDEMENTKLQIKNLDKEKEETLKEILRWKEDCAAKDEEINEIKLQLRKESIAHDEVINSLKNVEESNSTLSAKLAEMEKSCEEYKSDVLKQKEEYSALDKKSKEQFEKLKKFAANFKKKSALCTELETQIESLKNDVQSYVTQLEEVNLKYQQASQELSVVNSQFGVVQSQLQQSSSANESKEVLEKQITAMQNQIYELQTQIKQYEIQFETLSATNSQLTENISVVTANLSNAENNISALTQENSLALNKLQVLEKELEIKNEALSKSEHLDQELQEKQSTIMNLTELIEETKSLYNQFKCGQEAKIQEKDIYIESLESEIVKHKDRIIRLEDSVSTMEERRASLERKTDHLVTKLHEKDAKYSESSNHEDELEMRLAALIEHDEFIQKQLEDTQHENTDLVEKLSHLSESNTTMRSELEAARIELNTFRNNLSHLQTLEEERHNSNERISYLEGELKRVSSESTEIIKQKTKEYEYLETELHSLMSNTEIQRRQSREQFDKLQDELSAQSQILKELQQENEWLKAENETVTLQKAQLDKQQETVPQIDFVQFGESKTSNESDAKIKELTELLEDKEKQINTLSIQLQFASSGSATSGIVSSDSSHLVKELQSALIQKNQEIEHINSQFQSCLTQLTDAIESEKTLKQTVTDLSSEINFKIDMINRLEVEIAQLKDSVEQFKSFEPVVESVCQSNVVQVAASKKVDPAHKASASAGDLHADALKALEDQIVPSEIPKNIVMSEMEKKMIRNFEHDPPEPVSADLKAYFQSSGPTEEDFLQPKKAFLCYKAESGEPAPPVVENPFDEEDGWGWGNQETIVEDQQLQGNDNYLKVAELEKLIQTLTDEKNKLSADLQQSQQKTTKALLKLKEFKNKNEALSNEVKNLKLNSDFNMLDMTIQDELASQVKTLEEKIKELSSDASKEKLERDNLLKRIDVLTSANDRLTEMKEKQDIEMQICRNQNKGLSEKLKNLDWDNSFAEENPPPAVEEIEAVADPQDVSNVKDIIELIKKIQDLEGDNEELQAFIEDQQAKLNKFKTIEVDYEKLKNQSAFEIDELRQENDSLKQKLIAMNEKCDSFECTISQLNVDSNRKSEISSDSNNLKTEINNLQEKVNNLMTELSSKNDSLRHFEDIKNQNIQLQTKFDELNMSYNSLIAELQTLKEQHDSQIKELQNANNVLKQCSASEVSNLQNSLRLLSDENVNLKRQLENVSEQNSQTEVVDLKSKLEALVKEYYEFQEKFNEMASEKDRIEIEYNNIVIEKEKLDMLYKDVSEQEAACKTELIKLSYEKDELTEKYDKLLNKLSERNVSEETEQTIIFTDKLNNLTQELNTKNADIIELNRKVEEYETEKLSLQSSLSKLQEENYGLINNLTELRTNVNEAVDQRGMEVAEVWKQHVAMREAEFMNVEQALRQELSILQSQMISDNSLQTKETSKFVQQLSTTNSEDLSNLKHQLEESTKLVEETKQQLENVVSEKDKHKELYEAHIVALQERCAEIQNSWDSEKIQNVEHRNKIVGLTNEFENIKALYHNMQASSEADASRGDYDKAMIVAAKDKELQDCAIRIQQLSETYNVKFNDYEIALTNKESELDNVRQQLYTAENKLSDNVHEHEAELADMRLKLHAERTQYDQIISELKDKAEKLEIQLETKINECRSLNMKIESMIEGENTRLNELKTALESQEIEIVTLKENLTEQADTYEKLVISHMQEIHKLKTNRHVTFSEETKPGADIEEPATSSDSKEDNPARAELDLALYMLHQRDVRCEELTMELTQLLEERDTLQLKLSNALRANEALRSKINPNEIKQLESVETVEERSKSNIEDVHRSKDKSLPTAAGAETTPGETSSESDKCLETKISQLHKVGHMRDIRLRDEREHRMRQMELLQRDLQHLPPEAAARLREAHYTLTRDTQSASTVLLNWLWGKTTPKVVHM